MKGHLYKVKTGDWSEDYKAWHISWLVDITNGTIHNVNWYINDDGSTLATCVVPELILYEWLQRRKGKKGEQLKLFKI